MFDDQSVKSFFYDYPTKSHHTQPNKTYFVWLINTRVARVTKFGVNFKRFQIPNSQPISIFFSARHAHQMFVVSYVFSVHNAKFSKIKEKRRQNVDWRKRNENEIKYLYVYMQCTWNAQLVSFEEEKKKL